MRGMPAGAASSAPTGEAGDPSTGSGQALREPQNKQGRQDKGGAINGNRRTGVDCCAAERFSRGPGGHGKQRWKWNGERQRRRRVLRYKDR